MKISPVGINFSSNRNNIQNNNIYNTYKLNNFCMDTVTFSSKSESKKEENNLVDGLVAIGFVGIPLISSMLISMELMKHTPQGDKIFLSDGSYLCDIDDLKLKSEKVIADADDGILKVKDSPIDIDANKVDYADPTRGVYKNFDGTIDIDLLNQKYIDTDMGIYVDVKNGISKIVEDGQIKELPLLNFEGSSMCTPNPLRAPYHIDSNAVSDGIFISTIDNIKEAINILFGTHMSTGYMVDENGSKIPMREWVKEHDALKRDFSNSNNENQVSSFNEYLQKHHLPISVSDDGYVSTNESVNETSDNEQIDSNDFDISDTELDDYDFNLG